MRPILHAYNQALEPIIIYKNSINIKIPFRIIYESSTGTVYFQIYSTFRREFITYHDYIYTDQVHHEAGLSINGILGMARLDFTQRIDKPALYVGFGLTRFF